MRFNSFSIYKTGHKTQTTKTDALLCHFFLFCGINLCDEKHSEMLLNITDNLNIRSVYYALTHLY